MAFKEDENNKSRNNQSHSIRQLQPRPNCLTLRSLEKEFTRKRQRWLSAKHNVSQIRQYGKIHLFTQSPKPTDGRNRGNAKGKIAEGWKLKRNSKKQRIRWNRNKKLRKEIETEGKENGERGSKKGGKRTGVETQSDCARFSASARRMRLHIPEICLCSNKPNTALIDGKRKGTLATPRAVS